MGLRQNPKVIVGLVYAAIAFGSSAQTRAATLTVTNTGDSGAGSLRGAISAAHAGDTINFAANLSGQAITLTSGPLKISKSLVIAGPGPARLVVRGNGASRLFNIDPATTVTISGLTIMHGRAWRTSNFGAGIFNDQATLTISDCRLTDNVADDLGGAIYNNYGALTIQNSTFDNNSTQFSGGAIYSNAYRGSAVVRISNSTFSGNFTQFQGGAIFAYGASLQISTSTFSSNLAMGGFGMPGRGGGIFAYSAMMQISSSTFSDNSATGGGRGGAIYIFDSTGEIGSTILKTGESGENIVNDSGTLLSRGYNISDDAAGGDGSTSPGGLLNAAGDRRNTDPLLDPEGLKNNGGPTSTIALLPGSPAIDQGKSNTIAALASHDDQRGFPRPQDNPGIANAGGGDGSDVGAFELQIEPRTLKLAVRQSLMALLPTGDRKTDAYLQKAITSLTDSLHASLWMDNFHLTDLGRKVFENDRAAVQALADITGSIAVQAQSAIDHLLNVDASLAETAIADAVILRGDRKEIARAQEEFSAALQAAESNLDKKAVDLFKSAWTHARKAVQRG